MERELPHDKIPHAVLKKARAKGVANALILVLSLGVVEVIAFHILASRITAQMASTQWLEMEGMSEQLSDAFVHHEIGILTAVFVLGAIVLAPTLAFLGWKNGNYDVVQKWYLDALTTNANRDNLTGALNHRGLMNKLGHAAAIARRRESPLTLVFVDVTDLETIKNRFGDAIGDRQVVGTARALQQTMRQTDIIGRLRDDGFLVALIDCELPKAEAVMARAAKQLAQRGIAEVREPWTMNWGIAAYAEENSIEKLISRAAEVMGHSRP